MSPTTVGTDRWTSIRHGAPQLAWYGALALLVLALLAFFLAVTYQQTVRSAETASRNEAHILTRCASIPRCAASVRRAPAWRKSWRNLRLRWRRCRARLATSKTN